MGCRRLHFGVVFVWDLVCGVWSVGVRLVHLFEVVFVRLEGLVQLLALVLSICYHLPSRG